ncbi:hypothetical protein HY489_04155 [Candidatus Woesearchaeota archaeon]|nr:hypothetical protein [Candidatus Woesearchaeota archaeon]
MSSRQTTDYALQTTNYKPQTRGQMEIFGLVVIVILVALGLLFAVVVLTKKPAQQSQRVKESIQAANFLNTLLGTTVENCNRRTMRELVQDCALASVGSGEWLGDSLCEDGVSTCKKLNSTTALLLDATLGEWGKRYNFFMAGSDAIELVQIRNGDCKGEREGSTRPEIVRPGFSINVTLHICR